MKKKITLTESELHNIIKESVKSVLNEGNELSWFDRLERSLPWTDAYKTHQRAKNARARWDRENAEYDERKRRESERAERERQESARRRQEYMNQQYRQQQTQQNNDIYSQTIVALNRGDHSFFNGNAQLQGVLASLYNSGKITYREYDQGLQWIGRGYRYSNGGNDGLY